MVSWTDLRSSCEHSAELELMTWETSSLDFALLWNLIAAAHSLELECRSMSYQAHASEPCRGDRIGYLALKSPVIVVSTCSAYMSSMCHNITLETVVYIIFANVTLDLIGSRLENWLSLRATISRDKVTLCFGERNYACWNKTMQLHGSEIHCRTAKEDTTIADDYIITACCKSKT